MADQHPIERYQVYTRDEAAELMRMTGMELDDLLEASGAQIVDTGRRHVYLGETLLRVLGADFSTCSAVAPPRREISAQIAYPADEAARLLNISVRTLRRLARNSQSGPTDVGMLFDLVGEYFYFDPHGTPFSVVNREAEITPRDSQPGE